MNFEHICMLTVFGGLTVAGLGMIAYLVWSIW